MHRSIEQKKKVPWWPYGFLFSLLPIMRRYENLIWISIKSKLYNISFFLDGIIRKSEGGSMNFFHANFWCYIQYTVWFFSKGIWIVLFFFFFLNKLYENQRLEATSRVITAVLLGIYLLYIILRPLNY